MKINKQELRESQYRAEILEIKDCTSRLRIFRIQSQGLERPIRAGQFVALGLYGFEKTLTGYDSFPDDSPKNRRVIKRPYSFSHPILDENQNLIHLRENQFEFFIALVPEKKDGGKSPELTPRLFELNPGDKLFMGKMASGDYTLNSLDSNTKRVFLISTGTGEAPQNFMIYQLLNEDFRGEIHHIVCNRSRQDLPYHSMHTLLQDRFENFHYHVFDHEKRTVRGKKLLLHELLDQGFMEDILSRKLSSQSDEIFLCGNPSMIQAPKKNRQTRDFVFPNERGMVEALQDRGFELQGEQTGSVHWESYW